MTAQDNNNMFMRSVRSTPHRAVLKAFARLRVMLAQRAAGNRMLKPSRIDLKLPP
jgi:hypothetical protein